MDEGEGVPESATTPQQSSTIKTDDSGDTQEQSTPVQPGRGVKRRNVSPSPTHPPSSLSPAAVFVTPSKDDAKPSSAKKRRKSTSALGKAGSSPSTFNPAAMTERQQMAYLLQMTDPQKIAEDSLTPVKESQVTPGRVHRRNERGETPLHVACIRGDTPLATSLIEQGAEVNATDHAGWTPLHEACNHGHPDTVSLLLASGAGVNTRGMDGDTPLHDATFNNHPKVVKLLIEYGSDPSLANEKEQTPLDICPTEEIRQLLTNTVSTQTRPQSVGQEDRGSPPPAPSSTSQPGHTETESMEQTESREEQQSEEDCAFLPESIPLQSLYQTQSSVTASSDVVTTPSRSRRRSKRGRVEEEEGEGGRVRAFSDVSSSESDSELMATARKVPRLVDRLPASVREEEEEEEEESVEREEEGDSVSLVEVEGRGEEEERGETAEKEVAGVGGRGRGGEGEGEDVEIEGGEEAKKLDNEECDSERTVEGNVDSGATANEHSNGHPSPGKEDTSNQPTSESTAEAVSEYQRSDGSESPQQIESLGDPAPPPPPEAEPVSTPDPVVERPPPQTRDDPSSGSETPEAVEQDNNEGKVEGDSSINTELPGSKEAQDETCEVVSSEASNAPVLEGGVGEKDEEAKEGGKREVGEEGETGEVEMGGKGEKKDEEEKSEQANRGHQEVDGVLEESEREVESRKSEAERKVDSSSSEEKSEEEGEGKVVGGEREDEKMDCEEKEHESEVVGGERKGEETESREMEGEMEEMEGDKEGGKVDSGEVEVDSGEVEGRKVDTGEMEGDSGESDGEKKVVGAEEEGEKMVRESERKVGEEGPDEREISGAREEKIKVVRESEMKMEGGGEKEETPTKLLLSIPFHHIKYKRGRGLSPLRLVRASSKERLPHETSMLVQHGKVESVSSLLLRGGGGSVKTDSGVTVERLDTAISRDTRSMSDRHSKHGGRKTVQVTKKAAGREGREGGSGESEGAGEGEGWSGGGGGGGVGSGMDLGGWEGVSPAPAVSGKGGPVPRRDRGGSVGGWDGVVRGGEDPTSLHSPSLSRGRDSDGDGDMDGQSGDDSDSSCGTVVSLSTSLPIVFSGLHHLQQTTRPSPLASGGISTSPTTTSAPSAATSSAPLGPLGPSGSIGGGGGGRETVTAGQSLAEDRSPSASLVTTPERATTGGESGTAAKRATPLIIHTKDSAVEMDEAIQLPPKFRSRPVLRSAVVQQRRECAGQALSLSHLPSFLLSPSPPRQHLHHPTSPKVVYPPIHSSMYKLFTEQETERVQLRSAHLAQQDRLLQCMEQELIRAHQRASRQCPGSLSVCAVLLERLLPRAEAVCDDRALTESTAELDGGQSTVDERLLASLVQDVWDKFCEQRTVLLTRHRHEAETMWMIQHQQWTERLKDLGTFQLCFHSELRVSATSN